MDHTSNTLGILGQFQRRWSPLHKMQGNFTFWGWLEYFSSLVAVVTIVFWFPHFAFFFFLFVLFSFFLAYWLLESRFSPGEEEERGEEIGEEGKGSTLGST